MRFAYVATDQGGRILRGDVEARTAKEAVKIVRAKDLLVTDVRPVSPRGSLRTRRAFHLRRASLLERAFLARHLALMVRSGLTIDRAFEILVNQTKKKWLRHALQQVLESIRKGETLATALERHPQVFPPRFVAMAHWGEMGGKLPESLTHLATQLEHERDLQSKIRGAMVYPVIVVGAIAIVGAVMAIFVLPQLADIIASANVELPLLTRIFIAVSSFLADYGLLALPAGVASVLAFFALLRTKALRPWFHRFLLRIPIIGHIVRMVNLAQLNRVLGSLIQAGVPILDCLAITADVLGNVRYQIAVRATIADVGGGLPLGKALQRHPTVFPLLESDMVTIGYETGRVDEVLIYLAEFYEEQVNQLAKNLAQAVEPLLLIIIGVVVGGVVLAVMMPIYQLAQAIV